MKDKDKLLVVDLPCLVQKILAYETLPLPMSMGVVEIRAEEIKTLVNTVIEAQLNVYKSYNDQHPKSYISKKPFGKEAG